MIFEVVGVDKNSQFSWMAPKQQNDNDGVVLFYSIAGILLDCV